MFLSTTSAIENKTAIEARKAVIENLNETIVKPFVYSISKYKVVTSILWIWVLLVPIIIIVNFQVKNKIHFLHSLIWFLLYSKLK